MLVLGIESTAHTVGVGLVDGTGKVLANERATYRPPSGSGIHPREAASHHSVALPGLIDRALEAGGMTHRDVELVAFARGPGLGPCLRTGATTARALALTLGVPLLGVNHCVAHLEVGRLLGARDPLMLYLSGGNTQIIGLAAGRYRIFGETQDIGIGNMLDKFGRLAGLDFPAGPAIEALAGKWSDRQGDGGGSPPPLMELPYGVQGMDLAFSGLLTAAKTHLERDRPVEELCYSLQETAFAAVLEVAERALAHTSKTELLLGGGVACNGRLREMAEILGRERGVKVLVPPPSLCVDNGAMMAWLGLLMHRAGVSHELEESRIDQNFRTDQVEVSWH